MESHGAAPCEAEGRLTAAPIRSERGTFDASYFLAMGMRVSLRVRGPAARACMQERPARSSALPTPQLGRAMLMGSRP